MHFARTLIILPHFIGCLNFRYSAFWLRSKCSKFLWHCLALLCLGPRFQLRLGLVSVWGSVDSVVHGLSCSLLEYLLPKGGEVIPLSSFPGRQTLWQTKPYDSLSRSTKQSQKQCVVFGWWLVSSLGIFHTRKKKKKKKKKRMFELLLVFMPESSQWEHGFLVYKSALIYAVLCSFGSNVWAFTAQQYALLSLLRCILTSSSHHISKIGLQRRSLQKSKNQFQYKPIVYLLEAQNTLLIFQKFTSTWWSLTKHWSGTTLEPIFYLWVSYAQGYYTALS